MAAGSISPTEIRKGKAMSNSDKKEYTDIGFRDLSLVKVYTILIITLSCLVTTLLLLNGFGVVSINPLPIALAAMFILPIVYMVVRGIRQPEVLLSYNSDGLLIHTDNKEKLIRWDDIDSMGAAEYMRRFGRMKSGSVTVWDEELKSTTVDWLADVKELEALIKSLMDEYTKKDDSEEEDETENQKA